MSQVTIGIDVSKAQFDIFVSNGQNHSCKPNTPCGIKALIKTLSKLPDCLVVFEATGFYHPVLFTVMVDFVIWSEFRGILRQDELEILTLGGLV